jgi:hypothetical protein
MTAKLYEVTLTVTVRAGSSNEAVKAVSNAVWYGDERIIEVEFTNAGEVK